MVKPTPLAINLAAVWWSETPHETIREILTELKDNALGERLVERLTELDQLDKAKEIVSNLWGPESPFGKAEVLNTSLGSLLFRYVVEVNPVDTVKALEDAFLSMSKVELLQIEDGRRNLVWALEKLCFRKETFKVAAKILYAFAVSENETWGNNSTNQFTHLYQLFLAGTEVDLKERLEVIQWGLEKKDEKYTEVAIIALGRGLVNDRYSRVSGAEKQGSSKPLQDYKPSREEVVDYWRSIVSILTDIACSNHPLSELAREKIANAIRSLIRDGQLELLQGALQKIISAKGRLWMDALKNLKMTLVYEKQLPPEIVKKIHTLIDQITPTDIKNQLLLKISKPEWESFDKDESGHYIDQPKLNAENLATQLIEEKVKWIEYLPILLQDEQRQGFNFGARYSSLAEDYKTIIHEAITALNTVSKENQNPELIAGLLHGANDRIFFKKTVDRFINDSDLRQHAFYITRVMNPAFADILKLFDLVDKHDFSITHFRNFQYGRRLDSLTPNEVTELCERISEYGKSGSWIALSLLYMYCHGHEENWNSTKNFVRQLLMSCNMTIVKDTNDKIDRYHWSDSVIKILEQDDEKEFAILISKQIAEFCSEEHFNYSFDTYLTDVTLVLFENYFSTVWEFFGETIIGDHIIFFHMEILIGTTNGYQTGTTGILFRSESNYKIILDWCRQNVEIAPERIAHMMPLGISENDRIIWHPFSKSIIDEFGDNDRVLSELASNMGTFGFIGSRVPYYDTQKKLLEELVDHKLDKVSSWAKRMLEYTETSIKRERMDDEERTK